MNIYVGNLSFGTTATEIENEFDKYGDVNSVNLITDRDTGRSRGFAFVEMRNKEEGLEAIESLNQQDLGGRLLTVNEAKPRKDRW